MFCRVCGAPMTDANVFCAKCGTPVSAGTPPAQYQYPQSQPAGAVIGVPPPAGAPAGLEIRCVAGADTGKAFIVGASETVLGRASGIGVADSAVAHQHLAVCVVDDRLRFRCLSPNPVFVNSQPFTNGELLGGQDFMIGSCLWHIVERQHHGAAHFFESLQASFGRFTGTEKLEGFSLKQMFSEVFKKRTPDEVENYLGVGTPRTTPSILQVPTGWPKPWLFLRILGVVVVAYVLLCICVYTLNFTGYYAGIMMMGAMAVPLAVVVLFFELNAPRNVAFPKLLGLLALSGALSMLVALVLYTILPKNQDPLIALAGIVEESAKLATVVVLIRGIKYKYILNGLLFGAAVGTGFAIVETSSYILQFGIYPAWQGNTAALGETIRLRAWLSPFGHMPWAALAAGALWRVKGDRPLQAKMFVEASFLKIFAIAVVLHTLWDSDRLFFFIPRDNDHLWMFLTKDVVLGLIGWYLVFTLVQEGLKQVKQEQQRASKQFARVTAA